MRVWPIFLMACGRLDFEASFRDAAVVDDAPIDMVGPVIAPDCGASLIFRDDFDDMTPGPLFAVDNDPGITMTETAGFATVNFQTAVAANTFAFYTTPIDYPVAGLCVIADVPALPQNGGFALLKLRGGSREAEFFFSPTVMHLRTHEDGVLDDDVVGIAPDTTLRFWRFRVQSDIVYWDLSSDNVTYFEHRSLPGLFDDPDVFIMIGGGAANEGTTGVATAQFESVTVLGP